MVKKNVLVSPVLKWVGGKRQLLDVLVPLVPRNYKTYCEPFVGGGALLFKLQPQVAVVNDINADLINVYEVIQDNVTDLINILETHKNTSTHFYEVRDWDRNRDSYSKLSKVERAARTIYLNKTCFNGLFRVNNAGEFNSPFGNYRNPNIVNAPALKALNTYFNSVDIEFSSGDYKDVLDRLPKNSFVYLDPPYDPVSSTSNFTGYTKGGFDRSEQVRLRECCDELNRRGIKFMLSNSATDFIREQYAAYDITIVKAKRTVNSVATKRGDVEEVIVRNYE